MRLHPFLLVPCLAVGCAHGNAGSTGTSTANPTAEARLEPRSGAATVGMARFEENVHGVDVFVEVSDASPGEHGIHLHENGDCDAPDAASAGAHWNPDDTDHGAPDVSPHHAGDLGNLVVGPDGTGTLRMHLHGVTVGEGPRSLIGRALVVHADPDDLRTNPAGNSGARIACGVVREQRD